ncbi:MAG: DUF6328 family protein [Nitrososphaeraceae archaeon]|jgi:hypothetical protein
MSSGSGDNHTTRHSSEHYDIVGADLDWFIILATSCTIFFGFLLKIAVNPPSYFRLFDSIILLTALYAVTVATIMFLKPIIYHATSYRRLDVERFLSRTKRYVLIGIICVMVSIYLILGLVLNSKLPVQIAYSLPSLPFIFILYRYIRYMRN